MEIMFCRYKIAIQLVICATLMIVYVCLGCYVEYTTVDTGESDWRRHPNTISSYYTPVTNGVDPSSQSVWYLEVKSCQDAGILITSNPDLSGVLFEFILGSYYNTLISVQIDPTTEYFIDAAALNCTDFARLWLSWTSDGAVSLGAGDMEDINPYLTTPTPYINSTIGGIGINSCWGSAGAVWRYGIPSYNKVPDTCPGHTTTSSLSICNTTPSTQKKDTTDGYFQKEPGMQLSSLNQLGTSIKCTLMSCTYSCVMHSGCWYFRFDTSGTGCQSCALYDSSVNLCLGVGPYDEFLFKMVRE